MQSFKNGQKPRIENLFLSVELDRLGKTLAIEKLGKEKKGSDAEIDYVLEAEWKVIPVEVKFVKEFLRNF